MAKKQEPWAPELFHVAPVSARDSIQFRGLDPTGGPQQWRKDKRGNTPERGVYMFADYEKALDWRDRVDVLSHSNPRMTVSPFTGVGQNQMHDIWRVRLPQGRQVHFDTGLGDGQTARVSKEPIEPDFLELLPREEE